ncbi:hypothetical protein BO99DRAFT_156358 [Aspergillus violaceofuscus CBS 115571]|uniref:Uncharacterized protein n=1 Tax=Aspergillus violaceofuscus (strain CBS 115571) TaxID=1450538 RepID=A0A2V5HHM8_ASPV1|nr:hypothetical protein BO99DRAFT_156358 [Aspergillus violaceofuscus CBS 115571]
MVNALQPCGGNVPAKHPSAIVVLCMRYLGVVDTCRVLYNGQATLLTRTSGVDCYPALAPRQPDTKYSLEAVLYLYVFLSPPRQCARLHERNESLISIGREV